ncbi:DUF3606 domain-containing protein [Sphingobium abikonense]|jgi:hypothetical protein|uniref:DUF3606 domain-containing protein n=1 Tax=Sphingobium abikonense TaxID=86193 RepID=UPI000787730D|nr:DUF3606 domain-containing protein [Sphingobium abikonense]
MTFKTSEDKAQPPFLPRDMKHVWCERAVDTQYWTQYLGTSRAALEEAIERVGHNIGAVKAYLDRHRGRPA